MARLVVRLGDPSAELLGVRYGCRQKYEAHFMRQQDDAFFPHNAAVLVSVQTFRRGRGRAEVR